MLRKCSKSCFYLFFIIVFLATFSPQLKAQNTERTKTILGALAKLERESASQTEAEVVGERQKEITYRQRLKEEITEEETEGLGVDFDTSFISMPKRSLKTGDGKISLLNLESELSYEFQVMDELPIEVSWETQTVSLNDKEGMKVSLPTKLTGMGFGIQATLPVPYCQDSYLRLKVSPSFYSENWKVTGSTFRLPTQAFVIYQPNDYWTFIYGLAVTAGRETPIWPIFGFIYSPNENLTFNLIPERPHISYAFGDRITAFLEGDISYDEFKVKKDTYDGAILRYNEMHIGAGLEYKLNKYITTSFTFGRMFKRYLKYADSLGKVGLKNDYYTELRLAISI